MACHLHRSIYFPRIHEFLANLMRVTPIIVVPTSRETRETKLPWYSEFMNGRDVTSFALVKKFPRSVLWAPPNCDKRERDRETWIARGRRNLDRDACRFKQIDAQINNNKKYEWVYLYLYKENLSASSLNNFCAHLMINHRVVSADEIKSSKAVRGCPRI